MSDPAPISAPDPARPRPVRILVTGGTLDKIHDTALEGLAFPEDDRTSLPALLAEARCHHAAVETIFLKDSLDLTDADRAAIAARVAAAPETALVITHGTGTMGDTARYLAARHEIVGTRTVALTGAMRPYSLAASDAAFNVGAAVIAAQTLPAGVWGVMNGRLFPADRLHKDTARGRFDL